MVRYACPAKERGNSDFFLFQETKLGDVLGEEYAELLPELGQLATSTTIAELMASEKLQVWLKEEADKVNLTGLMLGFFGRCKVYAQASAPVMAAPVGECHFPFFVVCLFVCVCLCLHE
jgi:hypothetical protein